ncbi:hypothetical protein GC176_11045 [bacterium]|nr:hypothetical protein [bacterium]
MPIKVRCECGAGLTVPDAARGKTVKCKKCGSPVRVPGGPRRKKAAAPQPQADVHDEDFFNQLDLGGAEHGDIRICPKCAAEVDEEDIECPECGINLETGQLSAKQKKKRSRGGPDPDLYYRLAWTDSWTFFKKNWTLGLRLSLFWSFFMTLTSAAVFMVTYCEQFPPKLFWGGLATAFYLGSIGCFWQLWTEIVKATMDQKDELKRFNFDFFADVAFGVKAIFWPVAVAFPLLAVWAGVAGLLLDPMIAAFGSLAIYLVAVLTFPVAMCHLSAKYTWKAYIPYHMLRITFKNFAPVAWWWLIAICVYIVTIAISVVAGLFYGKLFESFITSLNWLIELCGVDIAPDQRGFLYGLLGAVFGFALIYLIFVILGAISCMSSFFMMRPTGLLAYYFARDLETGDKVIANEPAGFWIRYLAYLVDLVIINVAGIVVGGALIVARLMLLSLEMDWIPESVNYAPGVVSLVFSILYFTFTESGPGRATMGMKALGLTVVYDDFKAPISQGVAFSRYIGRIASGAILGIGFFMCAFDKDRKTLHDKMSKTRVVWKGEVH